MSTLNQRLTVDIGKKSLLHAELFPKSFYTPKQAREWLIDHNLIIFTIETLKISIDLELENK